MSSHKYIANLNIITKGRFSNKKYSYNIPNKFTDLIEVNQLVRVPFNNQIVKGIISSIDRLDGDNISKLFEIKEIVYLVNSNLIDYIEHLSNYYCNPIGHTMYSHFKDILNQKNIQKNHYKKIPVYVYGLDCRPELLNNLDTSKINIIYAPSLKSINMLHKYLVSKKTSIIFYQKTGGSQESILRERMISKNKSGIVISLVSAIFNPHMDKEAIVMHYWDTNNYSYTETRKPTFNLLDISNIQSQYTDHIQYYYSEFPDYRYVRSNRSVNITIPKIDVKYFTENSTKESLNAFLRNEPKRIIELAKYNFEFCSLDLKKELLSFAMIEGSDELIYKESSIISKVNVIVEPTVAYMNVLNSNRMARLIRYLNIISKNDSKLFVLTRHNHKFIELLSFKNINKWLIEEYEYRMKYGPSHNIKVIEINSKIPVEIPVKDFNGPIINDSKNKYTYQLMYTLEQSKNKNLYEDLAKFEYSFINYL